jgi:hypothetical protein
MLSRWISEALSAEALSHPEPVAQETGRLVAWLIERKFGVEGRGTTEPLWYAENDKDWHWWEHNAAEAKRFASKAEAEAFPAYQMIAADPTIIVTEHVFLAATPATAEPVAQEAVAWRSMAIGDDDPDEPSSYRELASALLSDFERYAEDETSARRMVSVRAYKDDLDRLDAKALTMPLAHPSPSQGKTGSSSNDA